MGKKVLKLKPEQESDPKLKTHFIVPAQIQSGELSWLRKIYLSKGKDGK